MCRALVRPRCCFNFTEHIRRAQPGLQSTRFAGHVSTCVQSSAVRTSMLQAFAVGSLAKHCCCEHMILDNIRSRMTYRAVDGVPNPRVSLERPTPDFPWSVQSQGVSGVPNPRVSLECPRSLLECPAPECPWSATRISTQRGWGCSKQTICLFGFVFGSTRERGIK